MAIDTDEIKDMTLDQVVDMISTFKLEELAGENRSDALTALVEAFSFIIKHTDKDKSDDFVSRFIEKFNEIKMEMETGEKSDENEDEPVESPTDEEQAGDKVVDPFVTPEKGTSNSFNDLISKASNFM